MTIDPLRNHVSVKQWGCEMGGWLRDTVEPEDNDEFSLPLDPRH
jgi:hypothetical protein